MISKVNKAHLIAQNLTKIKQKLNLIALQEQTAKTKFISIIKKIKKSKKPAKII